MSDLNRHDDDDQEYHFENEENFDFHDADDTVEEEFIGEEEPHEEPIESHEDSEKWENQRETKQLKKSSSMKPIMMAVGAVLLFGTGYYLMVVRNQQATPVATESKKPVQEANNSQKNAVTANNNNSATTNTNQQPADNTAIDNQAEDAWLNEGDDDNNTQTNSSTNTAGTNAATTTSGTPTTTQTNSSADVKSLNLQVQTLAEQNQTLTIKLQEVTAQSEAATARADSLETTVQQLQTDITEMNRRLNSLAPKPAMTSPHTTRTPSTMTYTNAAPSSADKTSLIYYVQAIIPGRAWIVDSNGHIVTLANGMQIEYGMVAQ
jgi:hypothetical protein